MTRRNRFVLPLQYSKGLNTEALSPLMIADGENTSISNIMEFYGGSRKRYGMTKIDSGTNSETLTGLVVHYISGIETLFKMNAYGVIFSTTPSSGTWSSGLNAADSGATPTRRWQSAKFASYENLTGIQTEYIVFTDFVNPPWTYNGTSCVSYPSQCTPTGSVPSATMDIHVTPMNPMIRIPDLTTHTPQLNVTINMENANSNAPSSTWSAIAGTNSFFSLSSAGGSMLSGSATVDIVFSDPFGKTPGIYTIPITLTFAPSVSHVGNTWNTMTQQIVYVTLAVGVCGDYAAVSELTPDTYYPQGTVPAGSTAFNRDSFAINVTLDAGIYATAGTITYSGTTSASGWITTPPESPLTSTGVLTYALINSIVSGLPSGTYTALVPIKFSTSMAPTVYLAHTNVTITLHVTSEIVTVSTNHYVPAAAKVVVAYDNRLFFANIVTTSSREFSSTVTPNRVVWTEQGNIFSIDDNSWEDVGDEALTAGVVLNNSLYMFSATSTHRIDATGNPDLPYTFSRDVIDIGCPTPGTVQVIKNIIIFEANDGTIRAFDGFKSYILSSKVLKRVLSDAPTYSGFDSIYSRYIFNSTATTTKLGVVDLRTSPIVTGGIQTNGVGLADINFYEENYPNTISFITNSDTTCYVGCTSGSNNYVAKLWDSSAPIDITTTPITFSITGKKHDIGDYFTRVYSSHRSYARGLYMEAELLFLIVRGTTNSWSPTGAANTAITVTKSSNTCTYTWSGSGTNPHLGSGYQLVGDIMTFGSFNTSGNNGTFTVTAVGTNYVSVTNSLGYQGDGAETGVSLVLVSSAATVNISVYANPSGTTVSQDVQLTSTGTIIPLEVNATDFTITIANSAAVAPICNIDTMEIAMHNIRKK